MYMEFFLPRISFANIRCTVKDLLIEIFSPILYIFKRLFENLRFPQKWCQFWSNEVVAEFSYVYNGCT